MPLPPPLSLSFAEGLSTGKRRKGPEDRTGSARSMSLSRRHGFSLSPPRLIFASEVVVVVVVYSTAAAAAPSFYPLFKSMSL